MNNNYKTALDKIHANEDFKRRTVGAMQNKTKAPNYRRFIPAVAAMLVVAVALTVLLIPHTAQHSFTLSASAAESTPLNEDSYVGIGAIKCDGGAYTADHYAEEFLTDISVSGENIDSITYSVTNGKIGLPDSCDRLTDYTGKTAYVNDGDGTYSSNGYSYSSDGYSYDTVTYSYYDTVTCSYDDPFTADDQMMMASQNLSAARESGAFQRYYDAMDQLAQSHHQPIALSEEEIEQIFAEYYNKVLQERKLNITVTYTDGKSETKTVAFSADCEAVPVRRQFYAYALDKNNAPYPVHDLDDAYMSFFMDADTDWSDNEDYNKVKDIFTKDDLIEFDDYNTEVILSAKLEN